MTVKADHTTTLPNSEALTMLKQDGIYMLDGILSPAHAAAIREDTEWFLSAPRPSGVSLRTTRTEIMEVYFTVLVFRWFRDLWSV